MKNRQSAGSCPLSGDARYPSRARKVKPGGLYGYPFSLSQIKEDAVKSGNLALILFMAVFIVFACSGPSVDGDADKTITILAIPGVVPPSEGAVPVTAAIDTSQYSGTIAWEPADDAFLAGSEYTANIELTAKSGWTLAGVEANSFVVAGALVTNAKNSGIITAVFPVLGSAVHVTNSNLAGTWRTVKNYLMTQLAPPPLPGEEPGVEIQYSCSAVVTRTVTTEGQYTDIAAVARTTVEEPIVTTPYYEASKGNVSLDGSGNATWSQTHAAGSDAPFADAVEWEPFVAAETGNIILISGKLFVDSAYRRAGIGAGLNGTWINESSRQYNGISNHYRTTIVFSDTEMSVKSEISDDGITYAITYQAASPITQNDDSSISSGANKGYYLLSGDWLVLGNDTAADCDAWVKE